MSELSPIGNLDSDESEDPEPSGVLLYALPPLEGRSVSNEQLDESEVLDRIVRSIDALIGAGAGQITNFRLHTELVSRAEKSELRLSRYKQFASADSSNKNEDFLRGLYGSYVARIKIRELESQYGYSEDGLVFIEEVFSNENYLIKRDENDELIILDVAGGDESTEAGNEKLPDIYRRISKLTSQHSLDG